MTDFTTNTRLLRQLRRGEPYAFEEFEKQYQPFSAKYARSRLWKAGNCTILEMHVAQEVLCIAWAKLPFFERNNPRHLRNWLKSVTQKIVKNKLRRERHEPVGLGGSTWAGRVEEHPAAAIQSETAVQNTDVIRMLREFLNASANSIRDAGSKKGRRKLFAADEYELMRLIAFDQLTITECAAKLGKKRSAVFMRWKRLLSKLKKTLEESV